MLERLAGALKRVGFDAVFDTSFAADVTIMEEASELLDRIQNGGVLPLFTSCSPAWVHWVETHRPDLIPHLSTCKSPQQMAGALIKEIYPRYASLGDKRLVVVSIMPCTAKKFEAQDQADVDYVLTTRELDDLWGRFGIDLARFAEPAPLDAPFAEASGAGRLFARQRRRDGSGRAHGAQAASPARRSRAARKVSEARGTEGVRHFTVTAADAQLNLAVVNGLGRLQETLDELLAGDPPLHFVEVMSCPGGCIGGGGQPYDTDTDAVKERLERLYEVDRRSAARRSHENADVQALYEDVLGTPLSEVVAPSAASRLRGSQPRGRRGGGLRGSHHERRDHHDHQAELPALLHLRARLPGQGDPHRGRPGLRGRRALHRLRQLHAGVLAERQGVPQRHGERAVAARGGGARGRPARAVVPGRLRRRRPGRSSAPSRRPASTTSSRSPRAPIW